MDLDLRRLPLLAAALMLAGCGGPAIDGVPPAARGGFALAPAPEPTAQTPMAPANIVPAGPTLPRAPAAVPTTAAATPAPDLPPAGGGSGPGAPAATPPPLPINVLSEADLPLDGATVTLADGFSATTDGQGQALLPVGHPLGQLEVSKPGYATSVVAGLAGLGDVHLRRQDAPSQAVVQHVVTLAGQVDVTAPGPVAVRVYYVDDRGNSSLPGVVGADGRYVINVTVTNPGVLHAVLVAAGADANGAPLQGFSTTFDPEAGAPATLALRPATRQVAFRGQDLPAGLAIVHSRLEVAPAGGPPAVLDAAIGPQGVFAAAADGIPYEPRVVIEARDAFDNRESIIAMAPANPEATEHFLEPPRLLATGASNGAGGHDVAWDPVARAAGYRVAVQLQAKAGPTWETWTEGTRVAVPDAAWPAAGQGFLTVEAISAAGFGVREIMATGPRALRVEPWTTRPAFLRSLVRLGL